MFLRRKTFFALQILTFLSLLNFALGKPEPFFGFYQSLNDHPKTLAKSEKTVEMHRKINDFDVKQFQEKFQKWSGLFQLFEGNN